VCAPYKGLTPFTTHLTLKCVLRLISNAMLQSAFKDHTIGKVSAQGRLASGFDVGILKVLIIITPFEVAMCSTVRGK
jgi:solute carrier family 25 (mitochondrial citrate transporter), member 1